MCAERFIDEGLFGRHVYHNGDGYSYHLNNEVTCELGITSHYLRCVSYRSLPCSGTAVLRVSNDHAIWTDSSPHDCLPDHYSHAERLFRQELYQACSRDPHRDPWQIRNAIALKYPAEVSSRFMLAKVRSAIHRWRRINYPGIPRSLRELGEVLDNPNFMHLTEIARGHGNFYAGTVGFEGNRSVVFLSQRMARFLGSVKTVFTDGTFVPAPASPKCIQVYQIVAVVRYNVIPIVQILMESRNAAAYKSVLQYLKTIVPEFRPTRAIMDFERAQQKVWEEEYDCEVVSCYVHHIRAVMKKAGSLGIKRLMNKHRRVRTTVRCLLAIPLLRRDLMLRGFATVVNLANRLRILPALVLFFKYYIKTWLIGWRRKTLSVFKQTHRTNNATESANFMLRKLTGPHHPSLWRFLSAIRNFENSSYTAVRAYKRGRSIGRLRKTSAILNDEAICNFTADLMDHKSISVKRFLLRASRRISDLLNDLM